MAIAMRWEFLGLTQDQYEAVMREVDLAGQPASGLVFHVAGPLDGGWQAVEAWESQQAWQNFFDQRFGPVLQKQMQEGQDMYMTPFPVHSMYSG